MGEKDQPSVEELNRISKHLRTKHWSEVFAGAAAVEVVTDGTGPDLPPKNCPSPMLVLGRKGGRNGQEETHAGAGDQQAQRG